MRIWITGVTGLLGLHLAWETLQRGWEVVGTARSRSLPSAPFPVLQGDLTDPAFRQQAWTWARPDVVVHTAALAVVDTCEQHPDLAYRVNAVLPTDLAREAAQQGVPFVHISTDAVFDGQKGDYTEEDPPSPVNVYGYTKLEGEKGVMDAHPRALVLRVNFFGWSLSGTRSLAEWFLNRLHQGHRDIPGFADVWFCPLLVNHLARLILLAVERNLHGLYHAVASRCLSKFAFGRALAQAFGYDPTHIQPISVKDAGLTAQRGHRLTLRTEKLTRDLGFPPPTPEEGLQALAHQAQWGYPRLLRAWAQSPGTSPPLTKGNSGTNLGTG